ncbi:MAG: hypothetical protein KC619_34735 [Myxococcales bacterium]|nr:hypothetical protein [Myxococcales bacterium]
MGSRVWLGRAALRRGLASCALFTLTCIAGSSAVASAQLPPLCHSGIRASDATQCVDDVCDAHPECCYTWWGGGGWSNQCTAYYESTCCWSTPVFVSPTDYACGHGEAGDCLSFNGTPGCNDRRCCADVCAVEPACCTGPWTSACAQRAATLGCGPDYDGYALLRDPTTTVTSEAEACGASVNDPVAAPRAWRDPYPDGVAQEVACGEVVRGYVTRGAGTVRDTDAFRVRYDGAFDADGDGFITVYYTLRTAFLDDSYDEVRRISPDQPGPWTGQPPQAPLRDRRDRRVNPYARLQSGFEVTVVVRPASTEQVPSLAPIGCHWGSFGTREGEYTVEVQCTDDGEPSPIPLHVQRSCTEVQDGPFCSDAIGTTCTYHPECCLSGWDVTCVANYRPPLFVPWSTFP